MTANTKAYKDVVEIGRAALFEFDLSVTTLQLAVVYGWIGAAKNEQGERTGDRCQIVKHELDDQSEGPKLICGELNAEIEHIE